MNTITAQHTATVGDSLKRHAIKGGRPTYDYAAKTLCGLTPSAFESWRSGGTIVVDCGNCARLLRNTPRVTIEITTTHASGYAPADHSECGHATPTDSNRAPHDYNCPILDDPQDLCTCSLECDNVGGRWLEGNRRELRNTVTTFAFESDTFAEIAYEWRAAGIAPILSAYTFQLLRGEFTHLDWTHEGAPARYDQFSGITAVEDDQASETFTEHRLTASGDGVTDNHRRIIFATLVS